MQELEPKLQGGLIREGGAYLRDSTVLLTVGILGNLAFQIDGYWYADDTSYKTYYPKDYTDHKQKSHPRQSCSKQTIDDYCDYVQI